MLRENNFKLVRVSGEFKLTEFELARLYLILKSGVRYHSFNRC